MIGQVPVQFPLFYGRQDRFSHPSWLQFWQQQDDYYEKVGKWVDPTSKTFGQIEPAAPLVGLIVYADGVNFKPNGAGAKGYWYWGGAAWVQLG